jgi:hypothetical protein
MREIASVFGLPDKPMEVKVPKDIVSLEVYILSFMSVHNRLVAHHNNVKVQRRFSICCSFPAPTHDKCPCRVVVEAGCEAGSYRW